jgi:putative spermidine/putrescine transport system ATP-binding protein
MSVAENVAYPLTVRKLGKDQIAAKVTKALDMVRLGKLGDRRPGQLSGGQQQRVALARALVFEPQLVLMDEPLGALDKQLREHMQIELKELHRQLGVTFVYVTHDQGEALTMSDRVAVFNDGLIQQIAPVTELYEAPTNRFVASFVGDSTVLDGTIASAVNGSCVLTLASGEALQGINVNAAQAGAHGQAAVRPERIEAFVQAPASKANVIEAKVLDVLYFGDHQRLRCAITGQAQATVKLPLAMPAPAPGAPVWLRFPPEFLRVYL